MVQTYKRPEVGPLSQTTLCRDQTASRPRTEEETQADRRGEGRDRSVAWSSSCREAVDLTQWRGLDRSPSWSGRPGLDENTIKDSIIPLTNLVSLVEHHVPDTIVSSRYVLHCCPRHQDPRPRLTSGGSTVPLSLPLSCTDFVMKTSLCSSSFCD